MSNLREKLAANAHEDWAHWTAHMLKLLAPLLTTSSHYGDKDFDAARAAIKRWERQIETPYADLTEREKDSDRVFADKVVSVIAAAVKD